MFRGWDWQQATFILNVLILHACAWSQVDIIRKHHAASEVTMWEQQQKQMQSGSSRHNRGAAAEADAIGEQQDDMGAYRHVDKHVNLLSCCLFLKCSSCHSSSVSKRLMKGWWNGLLHWCTNIQRHCLMRISGSFLDLFSVESYGLSCHRRMGSVMLYNCTLIKVIC